MPIQPRAPTLRANAFSEPLLPLCGLKLPAAISSRRKARTSWRSSLHSGGRSTGSKWKLMAIGASRTLGDERPQRVGAVFGDHMAELGGPMRLVAELLAPRPEPARRMVQRMLVGKAHRAVHLMGDRRPGPGRLADPQLGDRDFGGDQRAAEPMAGDRLGSGIGGGAGGGDFTGEARE